MLAETFWELATDPAHWLFEIMLIILFDGLVGALAWPFIKKAIKRHDERKHAHEHCNDVHPPATITIPIELINDIRYVKFDDLGIKSDG